MVGSSQTGDGGVDDRLRTDNCHDASTAQGQEELIEKVLKNVAIASEVLRILFLSVHYQL